MKRALGVVLGLLLGCPTFAAQWGDLVYTAEVSQIIITGYTGSGGDVLIPSTISGLPVRVVGNMAFWRQNFVTSCTFPTSLVSIGQFAFQQCLSLQQVVIPASVTNLGKGVFQQCTYLTDAYFQGDPPKDGGQIFLGTFTRVNYLPGSSGWQATYSQQSTYLWNPTTADVSFDSGAASCMVTGTPGIFIAFEVTTNLESGAWTRLIATNLIGGSYTISDTGVAHRLAGAYRIVNP